MKRRENEDARRETKDVAGLMSHDSRPHQPWPCVRLGDVCTVTAGGSAPQDKALFENGEYPFIRTSDVGEIHFGIISDSRDKLNDLGIKKLRLFPKGSILFPKSGASTFLNHRVMLKMDAYVVSHLAVILPSAKFDPSFLLYILSSVDARDLMQNSSYPALRATEIAGIEIPLPPLAEQKAIVARLTRELAAVDRLAKNFEGLESAAEAEFKAELKETFDALESEAAKVKLGGVCERLSSGKNITAKKISKAGTYPVYGANGIRGFTEVMNFEGECCIIGRQGALCGNVRYFSGQAYMSDHAVVATYKPKCLAKFMLHQLRHMDLGRLSTQAAQPGLSVKALSQEYVVLPPLPVQREIVSRLTSSSARRDKLIALARQGRNAAAQLRKAILKEAFA